MKIADATLCDTGWIARWFQTDSSWLLLNMDGTVTGRHVTHWYPHTGWPPRYPHRKWQQHPNLTPSQSSDPPA